MESLSAAACYTEAEIHTQRLIKLATGTPHDGSASQALCRAAIWPLQRGKSDPACDFLVADFALLLPDQIGDAAQPEARAIRAAEGPLSVPCQAGVLDVPALWALLAARLGALSQGLASQASSTSISPVQG